MKNNIVLIGFMGCGKSTVGKLLAAKTGYTLVDADSYIEQKENMTINEIFATKGEDYFRSIETEVVKELSQKEGLIVATGGGMVLKKENADYLRSTGFCVWLKVSPETVLERLRNDTTRPLLQRADKETAVKELMAAREPIYKSACHAQVCADGNAEITANSILLLFDESSGDTPPTP